MTNATECISRSRGEDSGRQWREYKEIRASNCNSLHVDKPSSLSWLPFHNNPIRATSSEGSAIEEVGRVEAGGRATMCDAMSFSRGKAATQTMMYVVDSVTAAPDDDDGGWTVPRNLLM